MKTRHPFIRYAAVFVLLLTVLTLSACGIAATNRSRVSQLANTPEPGKTPERPAANATAPLSTATPRYTSTAIATATTIASNLEPGFTTTVTSLPKGFPILLQSQFVGYDPAHDPCAGGRQACPVQAFPSQVWLYELSFLADSEMIGHSVADQYMTLLKAAGYQVEAALSDEATRLTFTGPTGAPARHGFIIVGPSVRPLTFPLSGRIIGIRVLVDQSD